MNRRLVLIPAYNEEEALPGTLIELLASIDANTDVLVVDDGSADATARVARGFGVNVISLPFNLGIGGALRAGFRYAERHGYQSVVQFDADGQHVPEALAALWTALDDGADLVIGSRFSAPDEYAVGFARGRAMAGLRWMFRVMVGRNFTDACSGFRGFGPRAIECFSSSYPTEYMESTESLMQACRSGLRIVEVPANMRQRSAGVASNRRGRLAYHYCRLSLVLLADRPKAMRPRAVPVPVTP
jgi:glycosyltransferase involved in cell wall biosynthesis